MNGPNLKGNRIRLVRMNDVHAPVFVRWFGNPEVVKYLQNQSKKTLREELAFIEKNRLNKNEIIWVIENENKKIIGNTALRLNKKDKTANLGIVIGEKEEWGKGYAFEVIRLLKKYTFEKIKYNRFELSVFANNERAIKLYRKSGFKKEGIKRQARWNMITKEYNDSIMMSILKSEYKSK